MNLIPDVRFQIVKWAMWAVSDQHTKSDWHYSESRPFHLVNNGPFIFDCSGFVTWCYWRAGASDPNTMNYDGYGYTGTLLHGKRIQQSQLHKGDVVVFGPGVGVHAALVVEVAGDPLCASHGRQGDPSLVRLSALNSLGAPIFLRFSTVNRRLKLKR
jgi:cell wall-associated NlpC family hydrolase